MKRFNITCQIRWEKMPTYERKVGNWLNTEETFINKIGNADGNPVQIDVENIPLCKCSLRDSPNDFKGSFDMYATGNLK